VVTAITGVIYEHLYLLTSTTNFVTAVAISAAANQLYNCCPPHQGHSQEFDLGGYKWVKETKQPHKNI